MPGSFMEQPVPGADVVMMGHNLHDWNLEIKQMLVGKAYEALSPGGAYIVYESIREIRVEHLAGPDSMVIGIK